MQTKPKNDLCVYCGVRVAVTHDHVPPKSFFPQPLPSNLVTVPSCTECNLAFGKDEEYFFATLMFSEAGISTAGKKLWDQKIHRMYRKNLGLRLRVAKSFRRVNVVSSGGIFLRRGLGVKLDEERFGKVVAKVIRGLYYFEYSAPLLSSTEVLSQFLQSESDATEPIKFNDQLLFGSRQWPNVFEYRFNRIEDLPLCSMWLIRFWGKIVFWAITGNDSDFAKNEILPSHSKTPTAA